MLSQSEGQRIVEQALSLSHADDVQVTLESSASLHLRFARNLPSTSGSHTDHLLTVRSSFGQKSAATTTNQLDPAALRAAVERSEGLARLAPEDPERLSELGAQQFAAVPAYDETAVRDGARSMVTGSAVAIEQARERDLSAAGFSSNTERRTFIGNRRGLSGYHRATEVSFSETARSPSRGGSGWAASASNHLGDVDYSACSARAVDKAIRSAAPRALAPGKYVAILEPSCVASLMQMMVFSMNRRSADEGRSYFSEPGGGNKVGKRLFPEFVSLHSDPSAAHAPGSPWALDGLAQTPRAWITNGVLENLFCERFWAQKNGREPIAPASNILMSGGGGSLEQLIAGTKRGVLITSLWYIRFVDPRTLLLTGLTRDGVFWVEDGQIRHPVSNFRWNDSPIRVLANTDAMTASVRASPRESVATNLWVPALRVNDFELSSVSDAI